MRRNPPSARFIALTVLICCAALVFACSGSSNSRNQFPGPRAARTGPLPVATGPTGAGTSSGGGYVHCYEDLNTSPETRTVIINDPLPVKVGKERRVSYQNWVGGPNYKNLQTCYFYNIAKKP